MGDRQKAQDRQGRLGQKNFGGKGRKGRTWELRALWLSGFFFRSGRIQVSPTDRGQGGRRQDSNRS